MSNVTPLPVHTGDDRDDPEPDQLEREQQQAVNEVLAEAAEVGRQAAEWVRGLAGRQSDDRHRLSLRRAADAIEQVSSREIVPGGEGQLDEELGYDLAARVITGSPYASGVPDLAMGERIALSAVCALAAAMPFSVLGELERDLRALAATMEAAVLAGSKAAGGSPE